VTDHDQLVVLVCKHENAVQYNFQKTLNILLSLENEELYNFCRVPDAYRIDYTNHYKDDYAQFTIQIFEVECSSRLTKEKLKNYLDLWWLIDSTDHLFMNLWSVRPGRQIELVFGDDGAELSLAHERWLLYEDHKPFYYRDSV
jgi:hypothetical protein